AQHGPGHVACDVKWLEAGKPAEYQKFMQDCMAAQAPYKSEEEQAPHEGAEQWEHPASRLGVTIFNNSERKVTVKLYSQNRRGKEWGPYEIANYNGGWDVPQINIDCKMDEYICIGAWDPKEQDMTWGRSLGHKPCDNCCIRCDGRGHSWQISQGGWSGFLGRR